MQGSFPAYYSVGSGTAVVLLHCTLSSKNQWRALTGMLEKQYRVIAVDLYGYGETEMPEQTEDYTLLTEAELVDRLLGRLLAPEERFHLVGHSYGGAVALRFAYQFPARVRTLTVFEPVAFHLLEPGDPGATPVQEMMTELARLLREGERAGAAATFLDYWSAPGSFANFPPRVQQDFARRTDKLALDFQALTRTPLTLEDYSRLTMPVTVLAGTQSPLPAQRVARELASRLPTCRLQFVETGHMGPVSHPELVNPLIAASLTRDAAAPQASASL
ncbi:alpha/beta hydrolase [Geomonas silvestris]|uniref:Alpha/beta hydrolase n=1 Tax=Geomonas silvestris TaxID=2740184 RepID=A0A6V8MP39_9BACT|nr:alpha/beta hydrolase [Geomonas silvestris]GFO61704.1 alpha/beta hydrolase [Geomonas silvestris]